MHTIIQAGIQHPADEEEGGGDRDCQIANKYHAYFARV